jgi:hypothetical protein
MQTVLFNFALGALVVLGLAVNLMGFEIVRRSHSSRQYRDYPEAALDSAPFLLPLRLMRVLFAGRAAEPEARRFILITRVLLLAALLMALLALFLRR